MTHPFKTAKQLHESLKNQDLTCTSLIENTYDYIDKTDGTYRSFLHLQKEYALEKAAYWDAKFKAGDEVPTLAGVPIAVKDNICFQGQKLTCGSRMLEHYHSPFSATCVSQLEQHGLISVGKANMDEFAMGSSTENSYYGPSKNPWNTDCVPGGSSGGSAAAVSSGQVPLSLGSDTGGSIRQPAAFCGIVGLKPTYGRVSRWGLSAFASSLDQIGPFSRTVEDCALFMNAISGHDDKDSTSAKLPVPDFTQDLNKDIKGLKIGVPKQLMGDTIEPAIKAAVIANLELLNAHGATWEYIDLPSLVTSVPIYYVIAPAEASANLSRYDGVRYTYRNTDADTLTDMFIKSRTEGFGPEVKRRIILGTFVLSSGYYDAYYLKAQKMRTIIREAFNEAFEKYDVIITPTTPDLPFKFGEKAANPVSMYMSDLATIPANMAGLPALSVPCGFSEGLPIGLQIMGKAFDETTVLRVGHYFQTVTDFHTRTPGGLG